MRFYQRGWLTCTPSSVIYDQYQVSMVIGISSSILFSALTDLPDILICYAALPSLTIAARDLVLITDGNLGVRVQLIVPPENRMLLNVRFRVGELVVVSGEDIATTCLCLHDVVHRTVEHLLAQIIFVNDQVL